MDVNKKKQHNNNDGIWLVFMVLSILILNNSVEFCECLEYFLDYNTQLQPWPS